MTRKSKALITASLAGVLALGGLIGYLTKKSEPPKPKPAPQVVLQPSPSPTVESISESTPESSPVPQPSIQSRAKARSLVGSTATPTPLAGTGIVTATMNYKVPPGVKLTVEYPITRAVTTPECDNWPNTPHILPCHEDVSAIATDSNGAKGSATQRWHYVAFLPPCKSGQYIGVPPICNCAKPLGSSGKCR